MSEGEFVKWNSNSFANTHNIDTQLQIANSRKLKKGIV